MSGEPAWAATAPRMLGLRTFDAMNTDVRLVTLAPETGEFATLAEEVFHDTERRFSRFLPDSELSHLNDRKADRVRVSPEMMAILRLCVRMQVATGGLFDPAILPALEHAGYDRSFERVAAVQTTSREAPPRPRSITEVVVDESRLALRLPSGVRLDLGGIGKGYTVDRARDVMAPLHDFVIDAGGDILAAGDGPSGDGWLIAVGHPVSPDVELARVSLHNEAIATSSIARRRWRRGAIEKHHIIDPRSGAPAETDCLSVSVIAPNAMEADVYAKSALILGSTAGRALLKARGFRGLFVLANASIQVTEDWKESEL
jgi:thiamine biosynthesis lipoprotein